MYAYLIILYGLHISQKKPNRETVTVKLIITIISHLFLEKPIFNVDLNDETRANIYNNGKRSFENHSQISTLHAGI